MQGHFKKKTKAKQEIPTAALPDIIFMLLFFFMVTTQLKPEQVLVEQELPHASQIQEVDDPTVVSYVYIGPPINKAAFGSEPRVQVNDVLLEPNAIAPLLLEEQAALPLEKRARMIVSLKVDKDVKMGVVSDVTNTLRDNELRMVLFNAVKASASEQ
ncbi:biopolymer transport protein ExbD [Thermonema lapsum]|jgi:biopolymer transport protein ExbD|uniref:Biopolymer transport protein ExbD n=1 Tax=Thermonema lapsum TaxID=28195 RepID=A0A846MQJ8_9BACT|nr:biopolymer transporter ExbD [Thermonema lapsum]NIK73843.1 biopolymer transport protein ExbD [Thermonema lapsum]